MNTRKTILDTIRKIRKDKSLIVSEKNQNIYRVVLNEPTGEKTAYYFNSPLYCRKTGYIVDKRFLHTSAGDIFEGSSATISQSNGSIKMSDHLGDLCVDFEKKEFYNNHSGILCSSTTIIKPTLNGVIVESRCDGTTPFMFNIRTTEKFEKIKSNSKYIAFMRNKFEPFFIISPLYAREIETDAIIPCTISIEQQENSYYKVTVNTSCKKTYMVTFEINIYEGKFFQDTTVESQFPDRNNCYGSVSFLGQTIELGEQWLYTKTSRKKVFDVENVPIRSVRMFIPVFKKGNIMPTAYLPRERFCSFGSTWKKKIPFTRALTTAEDTEGFYILDLSELLINPETHFLRKTEGIILRLLGDNEDCAVIATGDCCAAPQFLEITYRGS